MTIDELLGLLDMQEEILQFSHFTNADAWEVGNCIVAEAPPGNSLPGKNKKIRPEGRI